MGDRLWSLLSGLATSCLALLRRFGSLVVLITISSGLVGVSFEVGLRLAGLPERPLLVESTYRRQSAYYPYSDQKIYFYHHPQPNLPSGATLPPEIELRPDFIPNRTTINRTFTILMLGDSFTYGHLVYDTYPFASLVETYLTQAGFDVNVYNAGVPGYGIDQSLIHGQAAIAAIKPDLVIFNLTTNDLDDADDNCLYRLDAAGHYQAVPGWGSVVYWQAWLLDHLPSWLQHSRLVNYLLASLSPENLRYNIWCSHPVGAEFVPPMLRKTNFLLTQFHHSLPSGTNLLITLLPTEEAFWYPGESHLSTMCLVDIPANVGFRYRQVRQHLKQLPALANLVDFTDQVVELGFGGEIGKALFLNHRLEPTAQFGQRHYNQFGHVVVAQLMSRYLLTHYQPLPPLLRCLQTSQEYPYEPIEPLPSWCYAPEICPRRYPPELFDPLQRILSAAGRGRWETAL